MRCILSLIKTEIPGLTLASASSPVGSRGLFVTTHAERRRNGTASRLEYRII
jgi:hypothetical protein